MGDWVLAGMNPVCGVRVRRDSRSTYRRQLRYVNHGRPSACPEMSACSCYRVRRTTLWAGHGPSGPARSGMFFTQHTLGPHARVACLARRRPLGRVPGLRLGLSHRTLRTLSRWVARPSCSVLGILIAGRARVAMLVSCCASLSAHQEQGQDEEEEVNAGNCVGSSNMT